MTDQYRVDLAHLDAVTAKLGGLNTFVAESLREVTERIATVQQNWSGEAADAQAAAQPSGMPRRSRSTKVWTE
ncbi:hypothetical protein NBRGN_067_00310 [Nocardia brasiliensis NBRC 14402]|uniref:hypothetical protein n=1 Tax=Nocardia brasiliensis TaxID=37326 RepID=UPI000310FBE7|nr:hypothetical protein [Nocardia brasiliensis]AVL26373.1 hypothetical protein CEQ30_40860 [Nocardia brasiliensis]GAJ83942.1 hypothetical protein NBRGN_067_00310 [Nocardia brasiliensis NBRC 14402]SUB40252.1 WXG100 family type VII secretion target [Nocardia brasiliensis]